MLRPYQACEGGWLLFILIRDEEMLSLLLAALDAIDLLADPRFGNLEDMWTHRQALGDELQTRISSKASDEWLAVFAGFNLPVNRIAVIEELTADPQVLENNMAAPPEDKSIDVPMIINHPINVEHLPKVGPIRAPAQGEHSRQILGELGMTKQEIETLLSDGAVVAAPSPNTPS